MTIETTMTHLRFTLEANINKKDITYQYVFNILLAYEHKVYVRDAEATTKLTVTCLIINTFSCLLLVNKTVAIESKKHAAFTEHFVLIDIGNTQTEYKVHQE